MDSSLVPEGPLTVMATTFLAVVVVGAAVVVVGFAVVVVGLAVVVVGLAVVVVGLAVVVVTLAIVVVALVDEVDGASLPATGLDVLGAADVDDEGDVMVLDAVSPVCAVVAGTVSAADVAGVDVASSSPQAVITMRSATRTSANGRNVLP